MRTILKRVVTLGLLVGIGVLIARREGFDAMGAHLRSLSLGGLALALLVPLISVAASVRRWQILLHHEGLELSYGTLLRSFLRGRFVGAFTPSTTGLDLYRIVDVAKRTGRKAASGRAILVEKLYGLVALALVSMLLLPVGLARFFGTVGLFVAVGLGLGSVLMLVLLARPRLIPFLHVPRIAKIVDVLSTRPMLLGTHLRVLGLGMVSHGAAAATFVGTGIALGVGATPMELLVVGNAIVLATLVPISVGGLGVREGTAVAVLATVGVEPSLAALVGFLGYLVIQPPALLGGLLTLRPSPRTSPGTIPAV